MSELNAIANEMMPVYTKKSDCQDCYKCIRSCPVKAIKVEDNSACIIKDLCIHCGLCVNVCPVQAKKIRDDTPVVKHLIEQKRYLMLSIAPSWRAEFLGLHHSQLIQALKMLGFSMISETALGAQIVSQAVADYINTSDQQIYISTACPTVVELFYKYYPQYTKYFTPTVSPFIAHARFMRENAPEGAAVVFAGPCIAKKVESEIYSDNFSAAITFENLKKYFEERFIDPYQLPVDTSVDFAPHNAAEGGLYPIDGGMIVGVKARLKKDNVEFMSFSGIDNILDAMREIENKPPERQVFLELLACSGGCVNGPAMTHRKSTIVKIDSVVGSVKPTLDAVHKVCSPSDALIRIKPVEKKEHSLPVIKAALQRVGKVTAQDELNCGCCGYDSCVEFAKALLDGKAMENMCVSYMRKKANKKANALLRAMPAGVVIVDSEMKIIECNRQFASLFGQETELIYDAAPGMEGAMVEKIVPFHKVFKKVIVTGEDWVDHDISLDDKKLNVSIFSIEPKQVIGAVLQDIRVPHVRRDQVTKHVEDVIKLNLETVQKIAYLLGETAAETELQLNDVLSAFDENNEEKKDGISED